MTLTFVTAKCEMVKYKTNLRHCTKDKLIIHIQSTLVIMIRDTNDIWIIAIRPHGIDYG